MTKIDNIIIENITDTSMFDFGVKSSIGGRAEQQDTVFVASSDNELLAVVCDGMGGTLFGKMASITAIASIQKSYNEYRMRRTDPILFLKEAMETADKAVFDKLNKESSGTTLVMIYIYDNKLYWLSVGDSRLYILRGDELLQVTRDHNYLAMLNELRVNKKISDDYYEKKILEGDALISYIGMGNITVFDLTKQGLDIRPKDRLLLTTDGLYNVLPLEEIKKILIKSNEASLICDLLMDNVNKHSKVEVQDNTTFVVVDIL